MYLYRYRACYEYIIDSGACELDLNSLMVDDLFSLPSVNSTLIFVDTPMATGRVYPSDMICFIVIGNKYATKLSPLAFLYLAYVYSYIVSTVASFNFYHVL